MREWLSKFGGMKPEKPLTAFERSKAIEISGRIADIVDTLLFDNNEGLTTSSRGNRFMLRTKNDLKNDKYFSNADFAITVYGKKGSSKAYFFYRYGVDRFQVEKNRTGNAHLINKRDVRPGELKKLLEDIRDCLPH